MKIIMLKLTEKSKAKLRQKCPPKHPKIFCDHVTLCYNPPQEEIDDKTPFINQTFSVLVESEAYDKKGHAVVVDIPFKSFNKVPHITISTNNDTKPVYSNMMLEQNHNTHPVEAKFTIDAVLVITND